MKRNFFIIAFLLVGTTGNGQAKFGEGAGLYGEIKGKGNRNKIVYNFK